MKKHHVNLNCEVHQRLKALKKRFGLDFNDLISMALAFLEQDQTKIFIQADMAEVKVNVNKAHVNSAFAQTLMDKGYDIFIPKIDGRQAHYIKRKLQKDLNTKLSVYPITVKNKDGYLLMRMPSQTV